jgi:hypothetical protein
VNPFARKRSHVPVTSSKLVTREPSGSRLPQLSGGDGAGNGYGHSVGGVLSLPSAASGGSGTESPAGSPGGITVSTSSVPLFPRRPSQAPPSDAAADGFGAEGSASSAHRPRFSPRTEAIRANAARRDGADGGASGAGPREKSFVVHGGSAGAVDGVTQGGHRAGDGANASKACAIL